MDSYRALFADSQSCGFSSRMNFFVGQKTAHAICLPRFVLALKWFNSALDKKQMYFSVSCSVGSERRNAIEKFEIRLKGLSQQLSWTSIVNGFFLLYYLLHKGQRKRMVKWVWVRSDQMPDFIQVSHSRSKCPGDVLSHGPLADGLDNWSECWPHGQKFTKAT